MFRPIYLALATLACASLSASALAASDRHFLSEAMKGDNSEMRLGRMAEHRGHSVAVRRFGAMLARDHARAKAQALPVARAHGLAPTYAVMPEARREEHKLAHLSGASFDREFARYMVEDHRKDVADFRKQVRIGDRRTATLARRTLPVLRKHLRMAENLAG